MDIQEPLLVCVILRHGHLETTLDLRIITAWTVKGLNELFERK